MGKLPYSPISGVSDFHGWEVMVFLVALSAEKYCKTIVSDVYVSLGPSGVDRRVDLSQVDVCGSFEVTVRNLDVGRERNRRGG